MKLLAFVASVALSTLTPSFAITAADIAPAALAGKTLTFMIVNGGTPYATNGTWSGAFAASGNGFNVAGITGDTVPISTTFSATASGGFTNVSLAKFVEGQKPANLTLYVVNGIGNYEVSIQDLFGVSLNGTFTLGAAPPIAPEISIQQPLGKELTDGVTKRSFGFVQVSLTSSIKRFTIKNTGKARLTGLGISLTGTNKTDYIVGLLPKTSLAPDAALTFTVQFKPTAFGTRTAAIHIKSNDADENPFDIPLTGVGVGIK